jgi:hypothetical protein
MTTKPPSRLAATADDLESDQITKEHNDDDDESRISVDPSEDVTVEATEDVTTEATHTPQPSLIPGTVGVSAGQRAPTLLGLPIQSLPLPGVTSVSAQMDATRTIDYNDEITVLAQPSPADPLAALDEALDDRPSITDDDEEETKVEPAEAAMKAAESIDDVTTALSAQANLEREKALRRSAPASSLSDDLEFADPDADDQEEEESLDDELDDDEVISAGGAIEEEEDDVDDVDDGPGDGVATATFMKSPDTTGLSGLLNPRRPPTGGRDGFGSRLPTPYPPPQTTIPAPSTSPFASRLGPAPTGAPRTTTGALTAIQVPPPSGRATTETEPGFFTRLVPIPGYGLLSLIAGMFILGFGIRGLFTSKSVPAPTVIVAKPTAPVTPVVEPVQTGAPSANPEIKPTDTTTGKTAAPAPEVTGLQATGSPTENPNANPDNPEAGMWRPAKKPAAQRQHKPVADGTEEAMLKPKPAVVKEPKEPKAVVAKEPKEPKPVVAKEPKEPKPAAPAKGGKKAAKAWVDPFAN